MKKQFGNMTKDDFLAKMISFFPQIKAEVENHKEEYDEILFTCVIEDIVMPCILKLFEADDREKLKEVFAYFEVVSDRADRDLFNCFSVTVLEILGNNEQILRKAKEYMGPITMKYQREADLALGRKVYKYPSREVAERLLKEAENCNPGPWGNHSRTAAHCAETISAKSGMDSEKAYVLGLLHDIGRKFGKRHLGHVSDGYSYMMSLGYDDVARICLTHSFNEKDISKYIGNIDTTEEETMLIKEGLNAIELDDYDRLIQLCDSIAGADGVMDQIERMTDVKTRYGSYDQEKWDTNIRLRKYFEDMMGEDLYVVVDKEKYKPE